MPESYVYVATCLCDRTRERNGIEEPYREQLVKFGIATLGRFPKRMQGLKRKFNTEHVCRACHISQYHRSIEEYLIAHFEGRKGSITSRQNYENIKSRKSREHFNIPLEEALEVFENIIVRIGECQVNNAPCPIHEGCRSYKAPDE